MQFLRGLWPNHLDSYEVAGGICVCGTLANSMLTSRSLALTRLSQQGLLKRRVQLGGVDSRNHHGFVVLNFGAWLAKKAECEQDPLESAATQDRTGDLKIFILTLSQLSYQSAWIGHALA